MASIVKSLSFFFLLMVFSSLQIEASDRLYFSKVTRSKNNYNAQDPKLPLSYEQEAKPAPQFAALTTQTQNLPPPPPKQEPSFSRNQYGEYGFFGSTKDTSATTDTSSNNQNQKKNNNNNNNRDNFIYNMENVVNGNLNDNIWDELKQQGLSDTRSSEKGQYTFGLDNANKNRFNGYKPAAWRGSTAPSEVHDGESEKQNELDSLEEYEKYLQKRGYLP